MDLDEDSPLWRRLIRDLEKPLFYTLMVVTSAVGMLVWGATKTGSRGGGLFAELKPIFGTLYGLIIAGLMVGILTANRRWKALVLLGTSYLAIGLMELLPKSKVPATWDEFFALGAMLGSLLVGLGIHYEWFDE